MVAAPLGGLLIDRFGAGALLGAGAGLGMLGAAGASKVRSGPVASSQRFTPLSSLQVLREVPAYKNLVLAWVVWGLGSLMAAPLYALVLVDRFQAGYAEVGVLQLMSAGSGLLAYLVLGQYLDRRGGLGATPLGCLMTALVPMVYLFAPSLAIVGVAMVLQSVGTAVCDLGWQTALVSRVPDEHRLRYQAAHSSITGVRGAAAPFLGSLALSLGLGLGMTLLISGILGVIGAGIMAHALGIGPRTVRVVRATLKADVRAAAAGVS
jgi:MFS family permease